MILARIHFWSPTEAFTYVRIFYGWENDFAPASAHLLYTIIEGYLSRVFHLFGSDASIPAIRPQPKAATSSRPLADSAQTTPADRSPIPSQIGERPIHVNAVQETTCQIIKPPRIYARSLSKICRMVCRRQRQIWDGKQILDIEAMRSQIGPSINTLRKLPELVSNWDDPHYRWYADTWLREQSGHTPHEVANLLSDLREKLTAEDWAVVIARPDGKRSKPPAPQNRQSIDRKPFL